MTNVNQVGPGESLVEHLTVLRCQAGDTDAFAQLYEKYREKLHRYVGGLVTPDMVEDVVQEVWVTVYRRIAQLTNPGAFRQWAYRVARNQAFDALRRQSRRERLRQGLVREASTRVSGHVMKEDHGVESAMATLSPEHREVLQLRYFEDLPYTDIAAVVGCSVGTVRSRLHHAKRALEKALTTLDRPSPGPVEREKLHD